jgi:hypothetical protein
VRANTGHGTNFVNRKQIFKEIGPFRVILIFIFVSELLIFCLLDVNLVWFHSEFLLLARSDNSTCSNRCFDFLSRYCNSHYTYLLIPLPLLFRLFGPPVNDAS